MSWPRGCAGHETARVYRFRNDPRLGPSRRSSGGFRANPARTHPHRVPYTHLLSSKKVRQVPRADRFPLSAGLPPRLCAGKEGSNNLCELLGIGSSREKHAIVNAPRVKRFLKAIGHAPPKHAKTAERLRLGLVAYYGDPEERRNMWRICRDPDGDGSKLEDPLIPSLEHAALARYDDTVLTASPNLDELADCAALYSPDIGQNDWCAPALATLPRIRADIAAWDSLPRDRRTPLLDAALATATILDDSRLLDWAAQQADDIADQFSFAAVNVSPPSEPEPEVGATSEAFFESDVLETLRETTKTLIATAVSLADQPTAVVFDAVASIAADVAALREPVLERTAKDIVGDLIDEFTNFLTDKFTVAPWLRDYADEVKSAWREACPPEGDAQLDQLRGDLRRAEEEVAQCLLKLADAQNETADAQADLARHEAVVIKKGFSSVSDVKRRVALSAKVSSKQESELDAMELVVVVAKPNLTTVERSQSNEADAIEVEAEPDEQADASEPVPSKQRERAEPGTLTVETQGDYQESSNDLLPEADTATHVTPPKPDPSHPAADLEPPSSHKRTVEPQIAEPVAESAVPDASGNKVAAPSCSLEGAIWNALGEGRVGLAYQIARLDSSDNGPSRPSPELLAAVALGTVVCGPDDELAYEYGRRIAAILDVDFSGADQPVRDALNLLVLCASLRPALIASQQGGALPLLRRVELSGDLTPVYRLASAVADQAEKLQGTHLDVATLTALLDESAWNDRVAAHFDEVTRWRSSAASARFFYAPAGAVWKQWLANGGILAELARLLSTDRPDDERRVRDIRDQLANRKSVADLLDTTYRQDLGGRGASVTGRALTQFEKRLASPLDLANSWLRLIVARPNRAGFVGAAVERLRSDVDKLAPAARTAIEHLRRTSSGLPLASALARADDVIDSLQGLLQREFEIDAPVGPIQVLSDDLLFVPQLRIDENGNVDESTPREAALALLLDNDAHVKTLSEAFRARLDRDDLGGAHAVCERMAAEADPEEDACRRRLERKFVEERQRLRRQLDDSVQKLVEAFNIGEISDGELADLTATIGDIRRLADSDEVLSAVRSYTAIEGRVEEPYASGIARLQALLDPYLPLGDPREQALVQHALDAGDLSTLHEQFYFLQAGQPLVSPDAGERSRLASFLAVADRVAQELDGDVGPSHQALVDAASRREDVLGLNFSSLTPAQAKHSAEVLECWYLMSRHRAVEPGLLASFFIALGFGVDRKNAVRVRSDSSATVRTEPLRTRELCPVHPFGSDADGRYDVVLNWSSSARESIIQGIDTNPNAHTFVLHFGKLAREDREWLRSWSIGHSAQFITVDETLMLYLATLPAGALSALFACSLPFTCVEPFFTAPGLVPPESFFGRESERRAIMDRYGSCFVYGGRQLGKTALLHAAQSTFHAPTSHRLALYVDLRVHDIGISHGADHIWQVLWPLFSDLGVVVERSIPRGRDRLVDTITESVDRWLKQDDDCRILLLLDEADAFLADDLKSEFSVATGLKGLMDKTHRKFKVVLCGLHNVLRNTERANHPLAHLGEPICVGPLLENGDLQQARALVRSPMAAVGYTFENENLPAQILFWTNYYPSLIQIYGEALLRHVRQSPVGALPRVITADDIQAVFDRDQFRDYIRDRFLLTLQLDPRYEVIAYAMAFELLQGDSDVFSRGLDSIAILDLAREAWAEGFDITEREFGTLLQEMCGLGVLRQRLGDARQSPSYLFRNPNVLLLLGDTGTIMDVLVRDRDLPDVFEASAFHGHYPQGPSQSPRRGPLTHEQESLLKRGGRIAALCGTRAANLASVCEFLDERMGKGLVRRLDPCLDDNELARRLNALRPGRDTHVYLVDEHDPWSLRWIERAGDVLHKAQRGAALRVVFPADPDQLWRIVAELPDEFLEHSNGLFDWVTAQPWTAAFLRRWTSDQNLHEASPKIDELLELTGGWPRLLERYADSNEKTWKAKSAALAEYITARADELLDALGLGNEATRLEVAVLRDCGTLTPEEVEVYGSLLTEEGSHTFRPGVLRRRLFWASQLGLVQDVSGSVSLNPLVARILPASAA